MEKLKGVVEKNFPGLFRPLEVCMSAVSAMNLKGYENPIGMILMGAPSSGKTTILEMFNNEKFYIKLDDLTPDAFVSHVSDSRERDLLQDIKHKTLVTPELAPLFNKDLDSLRRTIAYIVRIMDGSGFVKATGNLKSAIKGHRGDYRFVWLGGTTHFSNRIWNIMGKLGNRLMFYMMPDMELGEENLEWMKDKYKLKLAKCSKEVSRVLNPEPFSVGWNIDNDNVDEMIRIQKLSILLSRLRGTLHMWRGEKTDKGYEYEFMSPVVEDHKRAFMQLYLLARGRALLYNRVKINADDTLMAAEIVKSSAPYERFLILKALLENGGSMNYTQLADFLNCSSGNIERITRKLAILGIIEKPFEGDISLHNDFSWLAEKKYIPASLSLEDRLYAMVRRKKEFSVSDAKSMLDKSENVEEALNKLVANGLVFQPSPGRYKAV